MTDRVVPLNFGRVIADGVPYVVRRQDDVVEAPTLATEAPTERGSGLGLRGVTAGCGRSSVLHGIDLQVRPGQRVAVLGPNGAGRTTTRFGIRAGFLSGGEQQMLAIGRAVVQRPELVLIDEMSLGPAPVLIKELHGRLDILFADVPAVNVEQNPSVALKRGAVVHVLAGRQVRASGPASEFASHEWLMQAYAGAMEGVASCTSTPS